MNDALIISQFATELDCLRARESYLLAKVEELQRQNAMLVEVASAVIKSEMVEEYMVESDWEPLYWNMYKAISATSDQSAAWLEASHIEWMKGLEPVVIADCKEINGYPCQSLHRTAYGMDILADGMLLYAIPTKKD